MNLNKFYVIDGHRTPILLHGSGSDPVFITRTSGSGPVFRGRTIRGYLYRSLLWRLLYILGILIIVDVLPTFCSVICSIEVLTQICKVLNGTWAASPSHEDGCSKVKLAGWKTFLWGISVDSLDLLALFLLVVLYIYAVQWSLLDSLCLIDLRDMLRISFHAIILLMLIVTEQPHSLPGNVAHICSFLVPNFDWIRTGWSRCSFIMHTLTAEGKPGFMYNSLHKFASSCNLHNSVVSIVEVGLSWLRKQGE